MAQHGGVARFPGVLKYVGGYSPATNTPDLTVSPSGIKKGDTYAVTVDGSFFSAAVEAGDMLIAQQDNPTLVTHWSIVQANIGGAIVDADFPGANGPLVKTGTGAYSSIKANLAATTAPAVTDDSAAGYAVGSVWLDVTADKSYQCVDASAGAAVWLELSATTSVDPIAQKKSKLDATTAPSVTDDSAAGYAVGSVWVDVTADKAYVCLDSSAGAAVWTETTGAGGGGDDSDAIHVDEAAEISGLDAKATPVDDDAFVAEDSADTPTAFTKVKVLWSAIKATLKTYFDAIYSAHGQAVERECTSRTIYVDADDGDDTTGTGAVGAPFETYSKALSTVLPVIDDGVTVTIQCIAATASYTPASTGRICIGTGKLVISGELTSVDTGNADADSNNTIVEDDGQGWTNDEHIGRLLKMTSGALDGAYRIIYDNDADTLNLVSRLEDEPDGMDFAIYSFGTKFSQAEWEFTGGTIDVQDIAVPAMGGNAYNVFQPSGNVVLTIQRVVCTYTSNPASATFAVNANGPCVVTLNTFGVVGTDAANQYAINMNTVAGVTLTIYRCLFYNMDCSYMIYCGANSLSADFGYGTLILGGTNKPTKGVWVTRGSYVKFYAVDVDGARDVIIFKNCTTGVTVDQTSVATNVTSATHITYTGNTTDYTVDAATFAVGT